MPGPIVRSTADTAPPAVMTRPPPLSELPPWDQMAYYGVPTEAQFTMTNNVVQIAKGDPLRAKLQFSVLANGSTPISGPLVVVSLNRNVTASMGVGLFDGSFPLLFSWDIHGPLAQQPWFAISNTGGAAPFPIVTVQIASFIRWPGRLGNPTMLEQVDNEQNDSARRANRNSVVSRINANSGLQLAEDTDSDIRALIKSCQRGHQPSCDRNVRVAVDGRRISLSLG